MQLKQKDKYFCSKVVTLLMSIQQAKHLQCQKYYHGLGSYGSSYYVCIRSWSLLTPALESYLCNTLLYYNKKDTWIFTTLHSATIYEYFTFTNFIYLTGKNILWNNPLIGTGSVNTALSWNSSKSRSKFSRHWLTSFHCNEQNK
jgi:hypothetical protein